MLPLYASALSPLEGRYKKSLFQKSCAGKDFQKRLRAFFKKRWCLISHLSPIYIEAGFST
jgi:hypothetical protein